MSDRLYVGSRKGLFELARRNGGWDVVSTQFLGDPVSAVLAHGDSVYAALDLGHFGAKLWKRDGAGKWSELAVPVYPPKPEDATDDPHVLRGPCPHPGLHHVDARVHHHQEPDVRALAGQFQQQLRPLVLGIRPADPQGEPRPVGNRREIQRSGGETVPLLNVDRVAHHRPLPLETGLEQLLLRFRLAQDHVGVLEFLPTTVAAFPTLFGRRRLGSRNKPPLSCGGAADAGYEARPQLVAV